MILDRKSGLFLALAYSCLAGAQQPLATPAEKLAAMQNPICVLPVGQTIDIGDIPADMGEKENWMAGLDSKLPVSLVSIPATHDAGTALGTFGWSRCQIFTIPAQLRVGIRGFDVRLRLVGNELKVYHSEESQKLDFATIMEAFRKFLSANPSEFLVMRIRQEADPLQSSESFEEAFEKVAKSHEYGRLFYRAKSRTEIPTVGQLRGKILLLDNYGKLSDAIDYPNPTMEVQDDYDTHDMLKKYDEIVKNFDDSLAQTSGKVWCVNYTSSSDGEVDQLMNAVRINPKVETQLRSAKGHLGLVLMNFPGLDVIHDIVSSNF